MINDDSIKKIMAGSDNIEKVFNRDGVLWQAHYDHTTTLIFKGNSGILDIAKLPPEYTWSPLPGQTIQSYKDSEVYFQPMWCPYDDQHQFYTGRPAYTGYNDPNLISDYVKQAPHTYNANNGNLQATLQTSLIDGGKKLQFTYTNTALLQPYRSVSVKYVKILFKL